MARSILRDIVVALGFTAASAYIVKALLARSVLPEMRSLGNPMLLKDVATVLQLYYADHQKWPDCSAVELVDVLHGNDPQYPSSPEAAATFVKKIRQPGELDGVDYFRESRIRDRTLRSDDGHSFHDAWGNPIDYRRLPDGTCEIRSAGEDRIMSTADDDVAIVAPVGQRSFPSLTEFRQFEAEKRRRVQSRKGTEGEAATEEAPPPNPSDPPAPTQ